MRNLRMRSATLAIVIAATVVISGVGVWYLLDDSSDGVYGHGLVWDSDLGLRFILDSEMPVSVSWSDMSIYLQATPTNNDPYELAYWEWFPNQSNLTSQDGQPITYSMQDHWGIPTDVQMFCNLTDVSGDGFASEGDFFVLTPMSDYADVMGIRCRLELTYEPTDGTTFWLEFTP